MLTQNDYRAALLQLYRAYRWAPADKPGYKMPQHIAYARAKAIIKPLPDDEQTLVLRDALECFKAWERNGSNDDLPSAKRLRLNWQISWTLTRSARSETR